MDPLALLRYVTSVISATTDESISHQIPSIASLLYSTQLLESALGPPPTQNRRKQEDDTVTVNRYKTQVSSLLQSKVPQLRWCGAVLAKCSVESSFQALVQWGPAWTRLLVPLVSRPEPTTTHVMAIRTLTRIFTHLSFGKPNLSREIVTPHLPAMFNGLLQIISASMQDSEPEVLATALEALRDLLRVHPVTARPFTARIRTIVIRIMSSASRRDIEQLARELWVALHLCASGSNRGISVPGVEALGGGKANTTAVEWTKSFIAVIDETHNTLDCLLEPIVEEYGNSRLGKMASIYSINGESQRDSKATTKLGFEELYDITDGIKRLGLLIRLLRTFLTSPTSTQVPFHLGRLVELFTRILTVSASSQPNAAIETSQREALLSIFPQVQVETVSLLDCTVHRMAKLMTPFIPTLLGQLGYFFSDQQWDASIKTAVYTAMSSLLSKFGPGLTREIVASIHVIIGTATGDLLPSRVIAIEKSVDNKRKLKTPMAHADSFLTQTSDVFQLPGVVAAASLLLSTAMARISVTSLPSELRNKMDRAAVVCGNEKALLAGVLFPPPKARASLLPHLVGAGTSLETEALIRPRLPVVWTGTRERIDNSEPLHDENTDDIEMDNSMYTENVFQEAEGNANKRIRLDTVIEENRNTPPKVYLQATAPKLDHGQEFNTSISPLKPFPITTVAAVSNYTPSIPASTQKQTTETFLNPPNIEPAAGISPVKPASVPEKPTSVLQPESIQSAELSYIHEHSMKGHSDHAKETEKKNVVVQPIKRDEMSGNESDDMEIPEIMVGESSSEDEDEG